jgi:IS5 family transposase
LQGNQGRFGMKAQIGVDAGTGYVQSVTATAASVHDLDQVSQLMRADDGGVYADADCQGAGASALMSPTIRT